MLNQVVLDLWVYGPDGTGFGVPRNAFFTPDPTDDIQKLHQIGSKDGMIWAGSDLNPGKFLFTDCLDFTKENPGMQGCFPSVLRISEKAFLHNNFINSETGYTPQQLVYGNTSGLSGICQLPRGKGTGDSSGSVSRLMRGIHRTQEKVAPVPLGVNFPYEPGDQGHFLGPKGRIGQVRILSKSGDEYCIGHSCTRISSSIEKCMAPTLNTKNLHSRRAALSPQLNTWHSV
jgi:hypothetical protein